MQVKPSPRRRCTPDGSGSLSQVVAEFQDAIVERQRDEVSFSVGFLPVVEDQTVGVVGHENHCHAELLAADTHKESGRTVRMIKRFLFACFGALVLFFYMEMSKSSQKNMKQNVNKEQLRHVDVTWCRDIYRW